MEKLVHPYIISLKDIFQTSSRLYIVTELVLGGELFDRLVKVGPYKEGDAKLLFRRILLVCVSVPV